MSFLDHPEQAFTASPAPESPVAQFFQDAYKDGAAVIKEHSVGITLTLGAVALAEAAVIAATRGRALGGLMRGGASEEAGAMTAFLKEGSPTSFLTKDLEAKRPSFANFGPEVPKGVGVRADGKPTGFRPIPVRPVDEIPGLRKLIEVSKAEGALSHELADGKLAAQARMIEAHGGGVKGLMHTDAINGAYKYLEARSSGGYSYLQGRLIEGQGKATTVIPEDIWFGKTAQVMSPEVVNTIATLSTTMGEDICSDVLMIDKVAEVAGPSATPADILASYKAVLSLYTK